ncbi:MAG TPA: hypothetical protein VG944_00615 [Fimbriimonas sp.]|nr:hypothetical protein [Fimbriimonas sp.]
MGLIERKLRAKGNEEFALPRVLHAACEPEAIPDSVKECCESLNQGRDRAQAELKAKLPAVLQRRAPDVSSHHFHPMAVREGTLVSFPVRGDVQVNAKSQRWRALVQVSPEGTGARVAVHLLDWITDQNGRISFRDEYDEFFNEVRRRLEEGLRH